MRLRIRGMANRIEATQRVAPADSWNHLAGADHYFVHVVDAEMSDAVAVLDPKLVLQARVCSGPVRVDMITHDSILLLGNLDLEHGVIVGSVPVCLVRRQHEVANRHVTETLFDQEMEFPNSVLPDFIN